MLKQKIRALKTAVISVVLFCAMSSCAFAQEKDYNYYYIEQYESSGAENLIDALPQDARDYMDSAGLAELDFDTFFDVSIQSLLDLFFEIASGNISAPLKGITKVMGIVLLSSLMRSLFMSDSKFDNVLNIVTGSAVAVCVFLPISEVVMRGVTAISSSVDFMLVLIPVFAGVITSSGNPTLALSYNSFALAAAQAVSQLADKIIVPLSGMFMATGVISNISSELKMDGLPDVIKKSVLGILSFTAAMFSGFLSLKSIMASSADTLFSKGVKLAVSSSIPIVGGSISESYSTIVGSLALLKNTVGTFGITAVAVINLPVIIELLFWIFGFKLSAVFASMLGDEKSCNLLNVISSTLTIINVMVLFCVVLFIISTGIILSLRT